MMTREESDSIGTMQVPEKAYYGVQALRARNNFHITGRPLHTEFIRNLVRIKKAAAMTNMAAHVLDESIGGALSRPATRSFREAASGVYRGRIQEERGPQQI